MLDEPSRMPAASQARRPRWLAWSVLTLIVTTSLSSCAGVTPLCDQADQLIGAARLGAAAETYARASQLGEGDCAETGSTAVAARYLDAYRTVATGRAAEDAGDAGAAAAAYEVALTLDAGNPAAHDGLTRLGSPVPAPPVPEPVPAPAPANPVPDPSGPLLGLVVTVAILLTAVLALVSWSEWKRQQTALKDSALGAALHDQVRDSTAGVQDLLAALEAQTAELRRGLSTSTELHEKGFRESNARDTTIKEVQTTIDRVASQLTDTTDAIGKQCDVLAAHVDEAIDYVGDLVRNRGRPIHDRHVRPEG